MAKQAYRYLQGYTLDPGFSTLIDTYGINHTLYRIDWEDGVQPGPCGEYIEVIDYDPASNCYYTPVNLNDETLLSQNGLAPSEGNPQFHQQFVYTVAMLTIGHFEEALGRKIIWQPRLTFNDGDSGTSVEEDYIPRLRIYPHAFRDANAYYDRNKKALLFGYFKAGSKREGANFPGGVVFTCLSPDIIAHEMTHAILDTIHPKYIEDTNPDVAAFHEGFADTIALLQRFQNRDLLIHQLESTGGDLGTPNVLGELATQMGNALDQGHGALRSAIGSYKEGKWQRNRPNIDAFASTIEPHERGGLFVAAIFEALIRIYDFKTKDLFRIAQYNINNSSSLISPDLINRLAIEIIQIARHLQKICIQALDFAPPCDITFGDYLRALVTADYETSPADELGYRISLIESFRAWGFYPERVNTLSIDSLKWNTTEYMFNDGFEKNTLAQIIDFLRPKIRELLGVKNRKEIHIKTKQLGALLHGVIMQNQTVISEYQKTYQNQLKDTSTNQIYSLQDKSPEKWKAFLDKLGMLGGSTDHFEYEGLKIPFEKAPPKIQVHSIRPVYRYSREGKRIEQVVVTLLQTLRVTQESSPFNGLIFRGGASLIFNISDDADLVYSIVKRINSQRRLQMQLDYQMGYHDSSFKYDNYLRDDDSFGAINIKNLHQID